MNTTLQQSIALIFGLFLFSFSGFSQERGNKKGAPPKANIKGKVVDADSGAPLEFATVTILTAKDSSIITGSVTDEKGLFSIDTRPGNYFVRVEFISYLSTTIPSINLSRNNMNRDLGTIQLSLDANMLGEIDVRAERSEFSLTLDKKVFNVGKDLANTGGTASDILDNVPSVNVDIEGNVSLRGNAGVRILVNGKPSGLIGVGGTNGLKSLPANMIEKVEVITNPSARYEAEGMAGIINIVLKKEQRKGLNGSFDFTVGYPANYGVAVNLNYRKKKLNFFTNLGVSYRRAEGGGYKYQEFRNAPDSLFITQQESERDRGGISYSTRFGADYFFTEKDILTTSFLYKLSDESNSAFVSYEDYFSDLNNPLDITTRDDDEFEDESTLEYAVTYKKLFAKKNQELIADIRYEDNVESEGSEFVNKFFNADYTPSGTPDKFERTNNTEGQYRFTLQLDYTHPISKEGKLEFGARSSFREIRNDYLIEEFTATDEWTSNELLSNIFEYDENIHALYAIYGDKKRKFSWQFGLRTEYADISTELLKTKESNLRDTLDFFPSAFLSYDLPNQNAIQLSYSRRVNRPRFWYLNPFFTLSDNRNYFGGNPNLNSEYTNSTEISHIKYWGKGSLSSALFYRHTTGVIERITEAFPDGTTTTLPQNLSTRNDYGLEFVFSYSPFKWWKISGDYNFFRSITEGENEGQIFESDTYSWTSKLSSKTTIRKGTDLQARFNYRAPRETTQGKRKAMYHLDIGLSQEVLKKNGTLTLNVRDVFNSRKRRYITDTDVYYTDSEFQWRPRQISLTLNYRLNQKKQRSPRGGRDGLGGGGDF